MFHGSTCSMQSSLHYLSLSVALWQAVGLLSILHSGSGGWIDGLQYASSTAIFDVTTREKYTSLRAVRALFAC